jgi:hypothetical protein
MALLEEILYQSSPSHNSMDKVQDTLVAEKISADFLLIR